MITCRSTSRYSRRHYFFLFVTRALATLCLVNEFTAELIGTFLLILLGGQFEQELNAHLLEDLNYGKNGRNSDSESIGDFLYRLPEYRSALENYPAQDNRAIFAKLDALLSNDCNLAKEAHKNRRNPLETSNSEN